MKYIIYLIIGVFLGIFLIPKKFEKINSKIQTIGICFILFTMGVFLGSDKTFFENLNSTGLISIVFALFTVLGSIVTVFLLSKLFFKTKDDKQQ